MTDIELARKGAAVAIVDAMALAYPSLTGHEIEMVLRAGHGALELAEANIPACVDDQRANNDWRLPRIEDLREIAAIELAAMARRAA